MEVQEQPVPITPYKYISELQMEQVEDDVFSDIKDMCLLFVMLGDKKFKKKSIEPAMLYNSYGFINKKINDVSKIKDTFNLASVAAMPFTNIGHDLDLVTVASDVTGYGPKTLYYNLATNVDYTLDSLMFQKVILQRMIKLYEGQLK